MIRLKLSPWEWALLMEEEPEVEESLAQGEIMVVRLTQGQATEAISKLGAAARSTSDGADYQGYRRLINQLGEELAVVCLG